MVFPEKYFILDKDQYQAGDYSIVPIRYDDRVDIMKWRNEQIFHLRQLRPLTKADQDKYFSSIVSDLFNQKKPGQLLFSFLKEDICVGYGGLVHIDWESRHAEISFIMNTALEKDYFAEYWKVYLSLIELVAFADLKFHKLFTYAFDLRKHLYAVLEGSGYQREATLKDHVFYQDRFVDVIIHAKLAREIHLRKAVESDIQVTFDWANNSTIRKYSFTKEVIEWAEHEKWFHSKIESTQCEYYLLVCDDSLLGSIRFDLDTMGNAMISYLIEPNFHGKGYGKKILTQGIQELKNDRPEIQSVTGFVMKENVASVKSFVSLGFTIQEFDGTKLGFKKIV